MCSLIVCNAQVRTMSVQDFVVSDALREHLSNAQIESMRAENPAQLIMMDRTSYAYSLVVNKLWEEDFNQMGYLEDYLPKGMSYSEDEIIDKGYVNPYIWKLPQDNTKYNLFKMRKNGYYVVVMPKEELEKRIEAQLKQYGLK